MTSGDFMVRLSFNILIWLLQEINFSLQTQITSIRSVVMKSRCLPRLGCLLILLAAVITLLSFYEFRYLIPEIIHDNFMDQSAIVNQNDIQPRQIVINSMPCPGNHVLSSYHKTKQKTLPQMSPFSENKVDVPLNQKLIILTPIHNAENYLDQYFRMLCSLSYPHHLISVALGEDSSSDNTLMKARSISRNLTSYFGRVDVYQLETNNTGQVNWWTRTFDGAQVNRRSLLAKARNQLLFRALDDEAWVLWIDVDVKVVPEDLIQHLLSAQQPVVTCTCRQLMFGGIHRLYDRNSWRETTESLLELKSKEESFLQIEGYTKKTKRIYLSNIRNEGLVVPLDGVGGCILLVSSSVHQKGLIFPPFVFQHHIETEGLAKMASAMGVPVHGLPFVWVFHTLL